MPCVARRPEVFARDASGQTPVLVAAANRHDAVLHVLNTYHLMVDHLMVRCI